MKISLRVFAALSTSLAQLLSQDDKFIIEDIPSTNCDDKKKVVSEILSVGE